MPIKRKIFFFVFCLLLFVLTGCQSVVVSGGLKILDENLGKALNNLNQNQASSTPNLLGQKKSPPKLTSANLSESDKQAIDKWLEEKGLNRYGDAKNAIYTGGTPLFNEATGQAVERYDYILNKFPYVLEQIKKGD
jgi:hypothetical protein